MRRAKVFVSGLKAGVLQEEEPGSSYLFEYFPDYQGEPVSLTMPITTHGYKFDQFPPFFDGLLPEGWQLENLLRIRKIDRGDHFSQLVAVGDDLVGNVTVIEIP